VLPPFPAPVAPPELAGSPQAVLVDLIELHL
jgi:hypothetical protein